MNLTASAVISTLMANFGLCCALLLAFSWLEEVTRRLPRAGQRAVLGLMYGITTVLAMLIPVHLREGVIAHLGPALVGLSGLFGGWIAGTIAAGIGAAFRSALGGVGAVPGAAALLIAALVGVAFRALGKRWWGPIGFKALTLHSAVLPPAMLSTYFLFPNTPSYRVLPLSSWLVLAMYGASSMLLGTVLVRGSKRRSSTAQLHDSEQRFRFLADHVPGVIFRRKIGPKGEISYPFLSEGLKAITGVAPGEVYRNPAALLGTIHPDDAGSYYESLADASRQEGVWSREMRIVARSGETRWVRTVSQPHTLGNGERVWDGLLMDVTEQKLGSERLQQSEAQLQQIFDTTPVGLQIKDLSGRILRVNPSFARMAGTTVEELLGIQAHQLTHLNSMPKAEQDRILETDKQAIESGVPVSFEYDRTLPGGVRRFRVIKAPLRGHAGTVTGLLSVVEDITDRTAVERAVRESRRLLRQVLDTLPYSVTVKDLAGRYLLVNRAKAQYHGQPPQELVGKTAEQLTWSDWPAVQASLLKEAEVRETGKAATVEDIRFTEFDGRTQYLKQIVLPLESDGGSHAGTVSISVNVTEELTARREAQVSHRRLADAIESFPGSFVLWDQQERLALWNQRWHRMFPGIEHVLRAGADYEECVRAFVHGVKKVEGPAAEEEVQFHLRDLRNPGPPFRTLMPDGKWYQVARTRVSGGGVVVVWVDITDAKRREDELHQMQKIDAIGKLTAGIAHDFNNLLTIISGNAEVLMHLQGPDAAASQPTRMIFNAALKAGDLTRRLLAFGRKQPLETSILDLNAVVHGMKDLLLRTLDSRIALQVEAAEGLWLVKADRTQVESALINLAVNSRDAMPDGGRLTVKTANAVLDGELAAKYPDAAPGEYVSLTVEDTGSGMPPDVMGRAFDPYFTTKQSGKGTGLGLSIVHGFVKQSGGFIRIESEVGTGTAVCIFLPHESMVVADRERLPRGAGTTV